ncbi:MAG: homoserine dehydrogenase [Halobacteriota archaeon]|nr:homoserine dehydrogenase [Halobacteriota archaeon]
MKVIRVSIVGFGVVGRGVAQVIRQKYDYMKLLGIDLKVVAISDIWGTVVDESGLDLEDILKKAKNKEIEALDMAGVRMIEEIDHDIVVETTPTNKETGEPGMTHMITALENKRNLVTSNKGPLALNYKKLMDLAIANDVGLRYEATVGGAMPIINLIRDDLACNEILSITGILNGTCNYILTRMAEDGLPYEHVLTEAQDLGIAEADPTYDVDGIDAACKLVILANSIFGLNVTYNDVKVTGIRHVTTDALQLARDEGYLIKLVGEVSRDVLSVAPRLIPIGDPLSIGGTLNVASIQTDLAGEITVTGKGAGSIETASTIVGDIISISKNKK